MDNNELKDKEIVEIANTSTYSETAIETAREYQEKQQCAEVQPISRSNRHMERSGDFSFSPIATWPKPPITNEQAVYFANSYYERFGGTLDISEAAERLAHGREMFLVLQGEEWIELNIGRSTGITGEGTNADVP